MARKKVLYWIVQVAGWGAYFLFSILFLVTSGNFSSTANLYLFGFASIIASIILSHGIRFFIVRHSLLTKPLIHQIWSTLLLCVLSGTLLEFFQYLITIDFLVVDFYVLSDINSDFFNWGDFLLGVSRSIILFLLWCGFYFVFAITEKSREQEILNLKWQASKNEIELKNLRAQLNPHFLFNALNSIRALVGIDPAQAKLSITHLSELLRQSINLGRQKMITLSDELKLVNIYLDLEKIRFEERLEIKYDLDEKATDCEIPPLMLQTIVENGVKHGVSKEVYGGIISICTKLTNNTLELVVTNTGQFIPGKEKGIGIENTIKRLGIIYANRANFEIREIEGTVVATIKIKYT
ncbi:sensor histidine kinase [Crocinitomix catalasitica]|uniref:sensor histidine kinase n=1 Tax=Crocinitomix catalasitica TaxID=184607 RepID=UPI0004831972|nr:histidine kinase [Crocinitomix catalasitica]